MPLELSFPLSDAKPAADTGAKSDGHTPISGICPTIRSSTPPADGITQITFNNFDSLDREWSNIFAAIADLMAKWEITPRAPTLTIKLNGTPFNEDFLGQLSQFFITREMEKWTRAARRPPGRRQGGEPDYGSIAQDDITTIPAQSVTLQLENIDLDDCAAKALIPFAKSQLATLKITDCTRPRPEKWQCCCIVWDNITDDSTAVALETYGLAKAC